MKPMQRCIQNHLEKPIMNLYPIKSYCKSKVHYPLFLHESLHLKMKKIVIWMRRGFIDENLNF